MRRLFLIVALALIVAPGVALADTVHTSLERFYSSGGTEVVGCAGLGCPAENFNIGDVSGTLLWKIEEDVFFTGGATTFAWSLTNMAFENPITSFYIWNNGVYAPSYTAPEGWYFGQNSALYGWWTYDAVPYGIKPEGFALDAFHVTLPGAVGVTFSQTGVDTPDGDFILADWRATAPVPEPATLTLLGTGLIGLAGLVRRKLKK